MYRDLENLKIEWSNNHRDKQFFRFFNKFRLGDNHYDEIKILYDDTELGIPAERQFYALAGIPHKKKWSSFYVERDRGREQNLFARIAPKESYIFIHDDALYGARMLPQKLPAHLKVVRAQKDLTDNIFDYCTVIERAEEIHVVDSVFMFLVDCLPYQNPTQKLFIHRYARSNPPWRLPILKKNWIILE
ncbi:MAG: hypothetical protein G01um101456_485 [Parcubacteria group bacterium Gr01-1014_56]|nr:MAG: hypothetical protein G01um101456_485 [Parcubacteria group bacterium Gr01-1014_56]